MLSLTTGHYEFSFASLEDLCTVQALETVNLKHGVLRLFNLKPAQVWIKLMELPKEYWMDLALCEISSSIKTLLIIDSTTKNFVVSHYARLLVDMNLSYNIFHQIMVERGGFAFFVQVVYEWLLDFCSHCKNIGHNVSTCCWLHPQQKGKVDKERIDRGTKGKKPEKPHQQTSLV